MEAHQSRDVGVNSFPFGVSWVDGWEGYLGSYYKLSVWRDTRSFIRLYICVLT